MILRLVLWSQSARVTQNSQERNLQAHLEHSFTGTSRRGNRSKGNHSHQKTGRRCKPRRSHVADLKEDVFCPPSNSMQCHHHHAVASMRFAVFSKNQCQTSHPANLTQSPQTNSKEGLLPLPRWVCLSPCRRFYIDLVLYSMLRKACKTHSFLHLCVVFAFGPKLQSRC